MDDISMARSSRHSSDRDCFGNVGTDACSASQNLFGKNVLMLFRTEMFAEINDTFSKSNAPTFQNVVCRHGTT